MPERNIGSRQPRQWRQAVTAVAKPIAQILSNTSGTTTFTATTAEDSAPWDLSAVEVGDILEADGYRGYIVEIDDVNDILTIRDSDGWVDSSSRPSQARSTNMPAAGSTIIVHRAAQCRALLADALDSNTADIFVGFSSSVTIATGHPIAFTPTQPNHRYILEGGRERSLCDMIDLTAMYVIAASSQELACTAL